MSGFIENFYEPIVDKIISKVYPELLLATEKDLGFIHFWSHLTITLLLGWFGWLYTLAIPIYIAIAEWPPYGRNIDRITRGAGYLTGMALLGGASWIGKV